MLSHTLEWVTFQWNIVKLIQYNTQKANWMFLSNQLSIANSFSFISCTTPQSMMRFLSWLTLYISCVCHKHKFCKFLCVALFPCIHPPCLTLKILKWHLVLHWPYKGVQMQRLKVCILHLCSLTWSDMIFWLFTI